MNLKIYTNGLIFDKKSNGHYGFKILNEDEIIKIQFGRYKSKGTTDSYIQYISILKSIYYLRTEDIQFDSVIIYNSSEFVINHIKKKWYARSELLEKLRDKVLRSVDKRYQFEFIPINENISPQLERQGEFKFRFLKRNY